MRNKYKVLFVILIFVIGVTSLIIFYNMKPKTPVTLTLWHNYGGQMKSTMDEMIAEFNATIGAEEGVFITVTAISGSSELHDKLVMAAHNDPGSPALPDITTSYPKTALILANEDLLADMNEYFTEDELSKYVPRFLEEGRLVDDSLYVFPTAKSTEVLFVNKTLFDRFALDNGSSIDQLATFEGILTISDQYYSWSDAQTSDIENDGKTFFVSDSLFNYLLMGCQQSGVDLVKNGRIDFKNETVQKVCSSYLQGAISGQYAIFDGYASDLAKTGDIVCSTGSTAGVLFFSDKITYSDNTSEDANLYILPYPVFDGQEKIAIQRGSGMCVLKSTHEKERLASIFLKWFTSPENNMNFVSSTGYLPVTNEAFGDIMLQQISETTDPKMKKLLETVQRMQTEYDFYITPTIDGIDLVQEDFEKKIREVASKYHAIYLSDNSKDLQQDKMELLVKKAYQEIAQTP